jgi:hypothetical protein
MALWVTQFSLQLIKGILSVGLKGFVQEAEELISTSAELKQREPTSNHTIIGGVVFHQL